MGHVEFINAQIVKKKFIVREVVNNLGKENTDI
jgi:hypothetical protein